MMYSVHFILNLDLGKWLVVLCRCSQCCACIWVFIGSQNVVDAAETWDRVDLTNEYPTCHWAHLCHLSLEVS